MKCPGCDGEMEINGSGRAYKHKDSAAAKAKGCKIPFIPKVREKGAVSNGNQEETRQTSQGGNGEESGREQSGGYREAVKRSNSRRGKAGRRPQERRQQHVPARTAAPSGPDQPAGGGARRGWLSDVTDDIFRK